VKTAVKNMKLIIMLHPWKAKKCYVQYQVFALFYCTAGVIF